MITTALLLFIFVIITLIIIFWNYPPIQPPCQGCLGEDLLPEILEYMKKLEPLEMQTEYKIKTNVNDLKRIYINKNIMIR